MIRIAKLSIYAMFIFLTLLSCVKEYNKDLDWYIARLKTPFTDSDWAQLKNRIRIINPPPPKEKGKVFISAKLYVYDGDISILKDEPGISFKEIESFESERDRIVMCRYCKVAVIESEKTLWKFFSARRPSMGKFPQQQSNETIILCASTFFPWDAVAVFLDIPWVKDLGDKLEVAVSVNFSPGLISRPVPTVTQDDIPIHCFAFIKKSPASKKIVFKSISWDDALKSYK
jgi:hypothetical protein